MNIKKLAVTVPGALLLALAATPANAQVSVQFGSPAYVTPAPVYAAPVVVDRPYYPYYYGHRHHEDRDWWAHHDHDHDHR